MVKRMCDFCKENEADRMYKVRRTYLTFPFTENVKVDICDECYSELFTNRKKVAEGGLLH